VGRRALAGTATPNLEHSSWLLRFYSGSWPFLIIGIALVLVWLAFKEAAQKAMRDREELIRSTGSGSSD
jgi:uncharacterized membrane protein